MPADKHSAVPGLHTYGQLDLSAGMCTGSSSSSSSGQSDHMLISNAKNQHIGGGGGALQVCGHEGSTSRPMHKEVTCLQPIILRGHTRTQMQDPAPGTCRGSSSSSSRGLV